jgi:hypothetical protein
MRTRVFLSPAQPQLVGKYQQKAEHVHVVCNASQAFSFSLPDLNTCENTEFVVYNLPLSAGNVTVTAKLMSTGATFHVLAPGDTVTFVSDLKSMWLLSDLNSLGSLASDWRSTEEAGTGDLVFQKNVAGTWTEKSRIF